MASITYDVQKQIKAIEKTPPIHTFLYDTFVQNEGAVLAEDAYWDYRKNGVAMAPFVTPGAGGKTLERDTFETLGMTFPTIAPERIVVHKDYAEQRSFGEEVYGSLDPQSRLARIMAKDLADLRYSIQMRKEWMTAQVLFTGQLDVVEYLDGGLTAKTVRQAQFNFTNNYIPDKKWGEAGYSVYDTFRAMGDMVHEGNGTVSIAVFGPEVRSFIEKDPELLKMRTLVALSRGRRTCSGVRSTSAHCPTALSCTATWDSTAKRLKAQRRITFPRERFWWVRRNFCARCSARWRRSKRKANCRRFTPRKKCRSATPRRAGTA